MIKAGRVIRIFDDENLVVNLGSADNLETGMALYVYAPPVEIKDPEIDEVLGVYRHLKDKVRIDKVFDRFCVAGPFPVRRQVRSPVAPQTLFQQFQTEYRTEPGELDVDLDEAEPLPSGTAIRVGDPVYVTLPDPEEEGEEAEAATADAESTSKDG